MPFGRFLLFLLSFFISSVRPSCVTSTIASEQTDRSITAFRRRRCRRRRRRRLRYHHSCRRPCTVRNERSSNSFSPPSPPEALESVNWITHARRLIAGTIRLFSFFLSFFPYSSSFLFALLRRLVLLLLFAFFY